jgi:hypothetical protein
MHLRVLEDYIAELASDSIDGRSEFQSTDEIVRRLMDIIILEESRIPDFLIDGDHIYDYDSEIDNEYIFVPATKSDFLKMEEFMKKLIWVAATALVGITCFFYGFFTAPERVVRK